MKSFTPRFCIASIIFFVPIEQTGFVTCGPTPSTQTAASWPTTAASTWSALKMSPCTRVSIGCLIVRADGLRSKAVTSCPCASACSTTSRPVPPAAPKITIFIMLYPLYLTFGSAGTRFITSHVGQGGAPLLPPDHLSFHTILIRSVLGMCFKQYPRLGERGSPDNRRNISCCDQSACRAAEHKLRS